MYGDAEAPPLAPPPDSMPDPSIDDVTSDLGQVQAQDAASAAEPLGSQEQLEKEGRWEELIASLIESAASATSMGERVRCYLRAASVYENQLQDAEKALITLQAAFSEDYGNAEVARELERVAAAQGKSNDLIADFEGLLPEVVDVDQKVALYLAMARWHQHQGDPAGADAKLAKASQIDPGSLAAVRARSEQLSRAEDWKGLAGHLTRSAATLRRQADRVALLLEAAEVHHRKLNDTSAAAGLYGQVLEIEPESVSALDGLVEITWDDENWAKALPLLEQLAASTGRPAEDRARTHQKAALAALRTGDEARARGHAAQVPALDPGSVGFVRDWVDIAYSRRWWQDVRSLAEWLQARPDLDLPDSERAVLRTRLGQALIEAGEIESARVQLEQAVALEPPHRRARELLADVLDRLGDAAAALEHKKVLVEGVGSTEDRFKMLVDMARAQRDQMDNKAAALAAFEEARALKPSERSILHETLELHTELAQWLPASEILLSLAEDAVPPERARYLVAAGNIMHYELGDSDAASELYERALDDDPGDLKTFERLDKILTGRKDWKEQERAYRRMIKRIGTTTDPDQRAALLLLWRGLAEIYRTRLGDPASAMAALEVCVQLDPDSLKEREALAELYEAAGSTRHQEAIEQRTLLFEKSQESPAMIRQLKAMRATYADAAQWDRVYNVCGALTVLQAADKEEVGFYERGAVAPLTLPGAALSEEIWQKVLYDPGEDRRLSLLFSCVADIVALARAQDPKTIGLKDRYRLDSGSDPSGVARLFEAGAGVLNMMPPVVYLNRDFTGDVEILNVRDPAAIASTTVMVGPNIVNGRVEKDVAFIIGRTLALLRPAHLVLSPHIVPTEPELTAIVYAAFKLCQPSAPVPNPGLYGPYLNLFQKMLPPERLESLASLVPWLIESWRDLDLTAWRTGAERTADRAGLLLCGDLGAAVRMLHASRGMAAGPAVLDLIRWSVTEGHLGLRDMLGITVA
jgi:tetratricopeptide (TPR) repeat protein